MVSVSLYNRRPNQGIKAATSIPGRIRKKLLVFVGFSALLVSTCTNRASWQLQLNYNNNNNNNKNPSSSSTLSTFTPIVIGYATSITSCSPDKGWLDAAAVLQHSIDLVSSRNPSSGSRYDYKLYAFVHPEAASCASRLEQFGYQVRIQQTPVNVTDIQNPILAKAVANTGCCGEREFLKLYSYTLVEHPVVVHLDLDVILLKPLDDLFDIIIQGPNTTARQRVSTMWETQDLPDQVDAFFTRDYNMIPRPNFKEPHQVTVQGGFLVVRPSQRVFEEYLQIIRQGPGYTRASGWGGRTHGYGGQMIGAAQIQGLCSYFYGHVHPNTSIELDRCIYNAMIDSPYFEGNETICREPRCQDCRQTPISDIVSAHFTVCDKPWSCPRPSTWTNLPQQSLCLELNRAWHQLRSSYEAQLGIAETKPDGIRLKWNHSADDMRQQMSHFTNGHCNGFAPKNYVKMKLPL